MKHLQWHWVYQSGWRILATGLGSGLLRPMPGTWGTLAGWALWWPMSWALPTLWAQVLAIALLFGLGVVACHRVAQALGVPDHGSVVIDEIVAFWALLCCFTPLTLWQQGALFILFRLFDITKPFPIGWLEKRLAGGWGVMVDDLLAALYAGLAFHGLRHLL